MYLNFAIFNSMYFNNSFFISSDFNLPSSFNYFENPKKVVFLVVLKH